MTRPSATTSAAALVSLSILASSTTDGIYHVLKIKGRRGLGLLGIFGVAVLAGWAMSMAIATGLHLLMSGG